ncbi:MAG TPA: hypothetical protein VK168_06770 [Saprospiraceae bacterium]|nr:hypothetical protein [Saprospiraceae bacterium]
MRKIAASFFLALYLLANTEMHELVKLGAFVQHYTQHKSDNPELGLVEFIVIHYFSGNVKDADYAEDMQLPFKVLDCASSAPTHVIPQPFCLYLMPPVSQESSALPIYDQSKLPSSHLSDIWQPPKAC